MKWGPRDHLKVKKQSFEDEEGSARSREASEMPSIDEVGSA